MAARVVESDTDVDGDGGEGLSDQTWARLEVLPDPRSPQGLIYPLPCLIATAVCAMTAAGHDRLTAIGQWVEQAGQADLARLRMPQDPLTGRYRAPDEKTIRTLLDRLDPRALARALLGSRDRRGRRRAGRAGHDGPPSKRLRRYRARRAAAARKALPRNRIRGVAVDGKTARGARRADGTRLHLFGIVEHGCGEYGGRLLDHLAVDAKHNETTHFTELLAGLDLTDTAVTFDALHTVRANLDWLVTTKNAHYVAVLKKNQPLVHSKVKALPWKKIPTGATTRESGHGRTETRTVKVVHVDRLGVDFPHVKQAVKLTRWRQDARTSKVTRETVYVITSLSSAQASPDDLARLVREHWSVEVHHHIRDVSFGEDTASSRTRHGPINLATIRAAVTAAIKDAGYLYIPEGRREHTRPVDALYLHGLLD